MKGICALLIPTFILVVLVLAVAAEVPTVAGPPSGVQKSLEQLGLHMDMYGADWVLHQDPSQPFSTAFQETLSALGCDLKSG